MLLLGVKESVFSPSGIGATICKSLTPDIAEETLGIRPHSKISFSIMVVLDTSLSTVTVDLAARTFELTFNVVTKTSSSYTLIVPV